MALVAPQDRNKVAAHKCRERKKIWLAELQEKIANTEHENH